MCYKLSKPSEKISSKYIKSNTYLKYEVPILALRDWKSPTCDVIVILICHLGIRNIELSKSEENKLTLEFKPNSLPYDKLKNYEPLKWLYYNIVSGNVYCVKRKSILGIILNPYRYYKLGKCGINLKNIVFI